MTIDFINAGIKTGPLKIDVSEIPGGMYLLELKMDGESVFEKVVIQR